MAKFAMLPPEINSSLMFTGAGSAPMLEAAAAWEGLASELSDGSPSTNHAFAQRVIERL